MLASVVSEFAAELERWNEPESAVVGVCTRCATSPIVAALDVREWPHDLQHRMVDAVSAVIDAEARVARWRDWHLVGDVDADDEWGDDLDEFVFGRRPDIYDAQANARAVAELARYRERLDEVFVATAGRRMDDYIDSQLEELMQDLGAAHEG